MMKCSIFVTKQPQELLITNCMVDFYLSIPIFFLNLQSRKFVYRLALINDPKTYSVKPIKITKAIDSMTDLIPF